MSTNNVEDPWSAVSPEVIEDELRPLLMGIRLVAELDLSLRGEVYGKARSASRRLISRHRIGALRIVCPSALVIFLVAEGVNRYVGGTFWPNVSIDGLGSPMDRRDVGLEFLASLERLGLETFEEVVHREGTWRYVTPILLHGGIPSYCASDLWVCLLEEMRLGEEDAGRLLARWRSRRHLLEGVDKPAQRFIFHGGDFAVDLVQRMIQLADDVAELGKARAVERGIGELAADAALPRYLAKKLLEGPREPQRRGPRVPRPRVILDSYGGEGPRLVLPPSPHLEGKWRVFGKGNNQTYKSSSYDEREVPLAWAPRWEVAFVSHMPERLTTFAPMEKSSAYVFDENGALARNQTTFRGDSVLVFASRHVAFYKDSAHKEKVPEHVELPAGTGVWSAWQPRRLDLSGLKKVVIGGVSPSGEQFSETVAVTESTHRPRLLNDHLLGVVDTHGRLVFGGPPRVRVDLGTTSPRAWKVRFRTGDNSAVANLSELRSVESDEDIFDLSPLFPAQGVISGTIEVVGPLGSDLRASVTIVPGMEVSMPDRTIGPDEHVVVRLSANVPLSSETSRIDVDFPAGKYTERVSVGSGTTELLVSVPRLVWTLRNRANRQPPLGTEPARIGLDELENGAIEAVLVRVGRPSAVRVELQAAGCLQTSEEVIATGTEGRWTFPVDEFRTTAAHAGAARLYLKLVCGEVEATAAVIEATHEVSDIMVESIADADSGVAYCEVEWSENRSFRDREVRLWSNHRPWETPTTVPIPDMNKGRCEFECNIAPGPYLLEVGLMDSWAEPARPIASTTNVAEVMVGTDGDLRGHLKTLDRRDTAAALELELAGRGPICSLDDGCSVGGILEELRWALVVRCRYVGPDCADDQVYVRLSELSLIEPSHLAEIISGFEDTVSGQDLARILITLVQGVLDCAPAGIEEPMLDRLWRMSPVAGAAFDTYRPGDTRSAGRWRSFTGWDPSMPYDQRDDYEEDDQLPSRAGPIQAPLNIYNPDRLREFTSLLLPGEVKVLRWSGYFDAAIDFLARTYDNRAPVERWRASYTDLAGDTDWLDPVHHSYLSKLGISDDLPNWCLLPRDLLACAFHLVGYRGDDRLAAKALWEAVEFAPELTHRSLVIAIALHRL